VVLICARVCILSEQNSFVIINSFSCFLGAVKDESFGNAVCIDCSGAHFSGVSHALISREFCSSLFHSFCH
jgi:hypothetical protein